jgi:hypothetical protein
MPREMPRSPSCDVAQDQSAQQAESPAAQLARQRDAQEPEPAELLPLRLHEMASGLSHPLAQPGGREIASRALPQVPVLGGEEPLEGGIIEEILIHHQLSWVV